MYYFINFTQFIGQGPNLDHVPPNTTAYLLIEDSSAGSIQKMVGNASVSLATQPTSFEISDLPPEIHRTVQMYRPAQAPVQAPNRPSAIMMFEPPSEGMPTNAVLAEQQVIAPGALFKTIKQIRCNLRQSGPIPFVADVLVNGATILPKKIEFDANAPANSKLVFPAAELAKQVFDDNDKVDVFVVSSPPEAKCLTVIIELA